MFVWQQSRMSEIPPTLPGFEAAVRGMRFIDRDIESSKRESWIEF